VQQLIDDNTAELPIAEDVRDAANTRSTLAVHEAVFLQWLGETDRELPHEHYKATCARAVLGPSRRPSSPASSR
jgi:hypothetical protein